MTCSCKKSRDSEGSFKLAEVNQKSGLQQQSAAKSISGGLGIAGDIDWPQDKRFGTTNVELRKLGVFRSILCCRRGRSGGWPSVRWIVVDRPPVDLRPTASARLRWNRQRLVCTDMSSESIPYKAAAGAELNSVMGGLVSTTRSLAVWSARGFKKRWSIQTSSCLRAHRSCRGVGSLPEPSPRATACLRIPSRWSGGREGASGGRRRRGSLFARGFRPWRALGLRRWTGRRALVPDHLDRISCLLTMAANLSGKVRWSGI